MSISLALSTPGAIPDLDTLLQRSRIGSTATTSTKIPTFISLAESMFNRELRTPEMELTITFTVSDEDTPLPERLSGDARDLSLRASPDTPAKGHVAHRDSSRSFRTGRPERRLPMRWFRAGSAWRRRRQTTNC
jgi:hypothetical protein